MFLGSLYAGHRASVRPGQALLSAPCSCELHIPAFVRGLCDHGELCGAAGRQFLQRPALR